MARTRQHVIETESRRIVASLLPAQRFLERDQTERDYGIDLVVECFDNGEPTGLHLLLQIKGTDETPSDNTSSGPAYDFAVTHLLRAARFVTPCLLVWCPVLARPPRFWYVWLQEYARVVLDFDQPGWRQQGTVRIHIPHDNMVAQHVPEQFARLRHIANHPRRLEQFGQLSRLTHDVPFLGCDPQRLRALFQEALQLDSIYGDRNWSWSGLHRHIVEQGLLSCEIALTGVDPSDEQLRDIGLLSDFTEHIRDLPSIPDLPIGERQDRLTYNAQRCARSMSNAVAVYFDNRLRNTLWNADREHEF